nr:increased DNA methylation 3-like [Coffea arabica]
MDNLHPEMKVKRIVWKSSSRERFANEVNDDHDSSSRTSQDDAKKSHCCDRSPLTAVPRTRDSDELENHDASMNFQYDLQNQLLCDPQTSMLQTNNSLYGPCMMPLLPIPNMQERSSDLRVILNGAANRGGIGPPVGAVDIGVSKSAYYFCVALPGVKKDPGEFSCEVERDGNVHVRGVTTTGARTVSRNSQVYGMKFQQQCPPGPFTLSFSLPGPVDPRLFSPNFRSDGIFEGVVVKSERDFSMNK